MKGVLEEFIDRATLMVDFNCTARTLSRYENLPDGLPSIVIAGRKLYRKAAVLKWVERQEKKPNRRRSA